MSKSKKNRVLAALLLILLPMHIPRKITPDGLTDAVIIVGYEEIGGSQQELEEHFERVVHAQGFQRFALSEQEAVEGQGLTATFSNTAGLIIGIRPGQIRFNGVPATGEPLVKAGSYIGWNLYKELLFNILKPLLEYKILRSWNNVAVRYINILP